VRDPNGPFNVPIARLSLQKKASSKAPLRRTLGTT
jgi:hypothetical protein